MMRFDWYQCTVEADAREVLAGLVETFPDAKPQEAAPGPGYGVGVRLVGDDGQQAARLAYGGRNGLPHVVFSGDRAPIGAALVRDRWPDHRVSRLDACEDFRGADCFGKFRRIMTRIAKRHRVRPSVAGDWILRQEGRTYYLGAPSSAVRARCYEKGIQVQQTFPDTQRAMAREVYPDDLVRLEVQVRPQTRAAMSAAAVIEPTHTWGFARWSSELARDAMQLDVPRYEVGNPWRPSDDDRALRFMVQQYGKMLARLRDDLGDWKAVGQQIGHEWDQVCEARERGEL